MHESLMMTPPEAAKLAGVCSRTVISWYKRGLIHGVETAGRYYLNRKSVMKFLTGESVVG